MRPADTLSTHVKLITPLCLLRRLKSTTFAKTLCHIAVQYLIRQPMITESRISLPFQISHAG